MTLITNLYNNFDFKVIDSVNTAATILLAGMTISKYIYDSSNKKINKEVITKNYFEEQKIGILEIIQLNTEALFDAIDDIKSCDCDKQKIDELERIFNAIKSCDCNHEQIESSIAELNQRYDTLNRRVNDTYKTLTQFSTDNQQLQNQFSSIQDDLVRKSELVQFQNRMIGFRISDTGTQEMAINNTHINEENARLNDYLHRRDWDAPPNYRWNLRQRACLRIQEAYPPGWRNNLDFTPPLGYILDYNVGEWVEVSVSTTRWDENWLTNPESDIPARMNAHFTVGGIVWNNHPSYRSWVWDSSYNQLRDRNWQASNDYIYMINGTRWIQLNVRDRPERWREDPNWNAPNNYVYDALYGEWIMVVDMEFTEGWRTQNTQINASRDAINLIYGSQGRIVWDEELQQNVWHPNSMYNRSFQPRLNFVWSIQEGRWRRINHRVIQGWRNNIVYINGVYNYIWNRTRGEIEMIDPNPNALPQTDWQLQHYIDIENETILEYITQFNSNHSDLGEIVWEKQGWVFKPNDNNNDNDVSDLSIEPKTLAEETDDSSAIAIPNNPFTGIISQDEYNNFMKQYGIEFDGTKPVINSDKPVYGDLIVKGNLIVNGTIESAEGNVSGGGDSYFKLKESNQLYLYRPNIFDEDDDYYRMKWEIDSNYNIPNDLEFKFTDYLFGHEWKLKWNGEKWEGYNCINMSFAKLSLIRINDGSPDLVVKHTDTIAKWIKDIVYPDMPEDHSSVNLAEILYSYLTNWRVIKKDGSIVNEGLKPSPSKGGSTYDKNNSKYNQLHIDLKVQSSLGNTDALYVRCDLNINDNITELSWDCNLIGSSVQSGWISTYGDNPCIESFNYRREKRKESGFQILSGVIDKNISIYIEKKFFDQEAYGVNPFGIIMQQQFYEIQPDPRNCTTLMTDKNIYSSKIIWADNIMTMRRDLNVVVGTVDTLGYEYAMLRQIVDNMVEQMRVQAIYNEYTSDIQKVLTITNTIMQLASLGFQLYNTFSALTLANDSVSMQTYTNAPYTPNNGGGGGGNTGGGGGGNTGEGTIDPGPGTGGAIWSGPSPVFPNDGTGGSSASNIDPEKFLINIDIGKSKEGVQIGRYHPISTTTTTTQTPLLDAFSSLTASQLYIQTSNLLSQAIYNSLLLSPEHLMFKRHAPLPEFDLHVPFQLTINPNSISIIDNDNNSKTEIDNNQIHLTKEEKIEDEYEIIQNTNEVVAMINEDTKEPEIELSKTTTETTQLTNTVPVITDDAGTDYQLTELADMTLEQLNDLASRTTGLRVETHSGYRIDVFYNGDLIIQRGTKRGTIIITPESIQMRSTLRRPTTSSWSIKTNGATWTARQIEQLSRRERWELDVVNNMEIGYWQGGNEETGETWVEIRQIDYPHTVYARIDYQVPITQTVRAGFIQIDSLNNQTRFGTDGLTFEVNDEDGISKVSIDNNSIRLNRNATIPTDDNWTFPGTNITARDFEVMNEEERAAVIQQMQQHGIDVAFNENTINETGEQWVDIVYRDEVVASIDRQIHKEINMEDGTIIIGNPVQYTLTQRGINWFVNGVGSAVVGRVARSIVRAEADWALHNPGDAVSTYIVYRQARAVSNWLNKIAWLPRIVSKLTTFALEESDVEYGLQPIIDWATYEGDGVDVEITCEHADELAVSLEACVEIGKTFRDTLKGPLAIICEEIKQLKDNTSSGGTILEATDEFDTVEGFPYYYVKNEDIITDTKPLTGIAEPNKTYSYNTIKIDMNISFVPNILYMNGELSIMYLLSQDALVAKKPEIKCDIINAKNAFKLHESDVHYFYNKHAVQGIFRRKISPKYPKPKYYHLIYKRIALKIKK